MSLCLARDNAAVEIDCRSLQHRYVPLPDDIAFLAVNSMVKHALGGSAYRKRVEECAAAVEIIQRRNSAVESLRDVTPEMLAAAKDDLPDAIARRARHVVTENARVERFVEASAPSDLAAMGQLFLESHRSSAARLRGELRRTGLPGRYAISDRWSLRRPYDRRRLRRLHRKHAAPGSGCGIPRDALRTYTNANSTLRLRSMSANLRAGPPKSLKLIEKKYVLARLYRQRVSQEKMSSWGRPRVCPFSIRTRKSHTANRYSLDARPL